MSQFDHILITGASSGIGEALALHYAKAKVKRLSLCGRDASRLESVAARCRELGVETQTKILDVTEAAAVEAWLTKCHAQMPLNLVFANAGVATLEETPSNVRRTFDVNVMGVVNTVLPAVKLMQSSTSASDKHIVITASIAGYHGMPACPSYAASKACVKAWGEGLRLRLAPLGIKVSTVCPGFVRSRITDKNTCPMPYFMEADKAAAIIAKRVSQNVGLIAFPWQMRLAVWLGSILPNRLSDFIYSRLPYKV